MLCQLATLLYIAWISDSLVRLLFAWILCKVIKTYILHGIPIRTSCFGTWIRHASCYIILISSNLSKNALHSFLALIILNPSVVTVEIHISKFSALIISSLLISNCISVFDQPYSYLCVGLYISDNDRYCPGFDRDRQSPGYTYFLRCQM